MQEVMPSRCHKLSTRASERGACQEHHLRILVHRSRPLCQAAAYTRIDYKEQATTLSGKDQGHRMMSLGASHQASRDLTLQVERCRGLSATSLDKVQSRHGLISMMTA